MTDFCQKPRDPPDLEFEVLHVHLEVLLLRHFQPGVSNCREGHCLGAMGAV